MQGLSKQITANQLAAKGIKLSIRDQFPLKQQDAPVKEDDESGLVFVDPEVERRA